MSDVDISILENCTGRQLKELLALASTNTQVTPNWLLEIGDSEQLEYLLTEILRATGESGGQLVQVVCCPETPVEVLVAIKSTAKRLVVAAESPAHTAAATLLYHLAVASALGNHARNISSRDPVERLPLYKEMAAELCDDELAAVFEKAIDGLASSTA
jgi:hypothetical protein